MNNCFSVDYRPIKPYFEPLYHLYLSSYQTCPKNLYKLSLMLVGKSKNY